jgi:endonuclease I
VGLLVGQRMITDLAVVLVLLAAAVAMFVINKPRIDAAYPRRGIIPEKNRTLFEAWDREDPVNAWERERARRIEQLQGNTNPFVK